MRIIQAAPLFIGITAALTLAFTNCSKVDFASTPGTAKVAGGGTGATGPGDTAPGNGPDTALPPPPDVAVANCAQAAKSGALKTSSQTIEFKDPKVELKRSVVCQWDQGDNLSEKDGYIRARNDQFVNLNLPANAVICGVDMKTSIQKFKYDDVFYLTFNNRILASNLKRSVTPISPEPIRTSSGADVPLYTYDWLKVRDADFRSVNDTADDYCLGADQGKGVCKWPLSQQTGDIQFSFDSELLINIGLKASSNSQKFGFIVTGDNDPDTDCYHEPLAFDTTIKYYIQ